MKRFLLLSMCFLLVFLASCGNTVRDDDASDGISDNDNTSSEAVGDSSAPDESSVQEEKSDQYDDPKYNGVAKLYITVKNTVTKEEYVPCTIQLLDPSGEYEEITDENGKIKVRGNSTSAGAKKPYNVKFSSSQRPLGLGKGKKFCLLANLYDKTLIRNRLSYDFASEVGGCHYTPRTEYVDVYLNNRFLGNYLMTQAVGEGKEKVDIDITKNEFLFEYEPFVGYSNPNCIATPILGILLGFNEPEQPTAEQFEWLNLFFAEAESALVSYDFERIAEYFDIDSFVDFYIVNELFKDVDFSTSSTRFYLKKGRLYAGPLWDMDLSSGNVSEEAGYYGEYWNSNTSGDSTESFYCRKIWYRELFGCQKFGELVRKRYAKLQPQIVNLTTDNELGLNRIDRLIAKYGKSFAANYEKAGWSVSYVYGEFESRYPAKTYEGNVEYLREWLIRRNAWLLHELGIS